MNTKWEEKSKGVWRGYILFDNKKEEDKTSDINDEGYFSWFYSWFY